MSGNLAFGSSRAHLNPLNTAWLGKQVSEAWWWYLFTTGGQNSQVCTDVVRNTNIAYYGYSSNIRAEYLSSHYDRKYPETGNTLSSYEIRLNQSVFNNTFPAKFQNGTTYQTYQP
jgi:hypothetical protein